MKPGITRWKMTPSYRGLPVTRSPLRGSVHDFSPVARPTKLDTVLGASLENSRTTMGPWFVSSVAWMSWPAWTFFIHSPGASAAGAEGVVGDGVELPVASFFSVESVSAEAEKVRHRRRALRILLFMGRAD